MNNRNRPSLQVFFIFVCFLMFATNIGHSAQGVLLSDLIDHYGLKSASQGLFSTFQSIGCIAACILVVILAGKIRRSRMLLCSISFMTAAIALMSLRLPIFAALPVYTLFGIGYASTSVVSSSFAATIYPGKQSVMGILHAFLGTGGLLAPLLLRRLRQGLPWNRVYAADALILLVVWLLYFFAMNATGVGQVERNDSRGKITLSGLKTFLSRPRNLLLLLAAFGYMGFQNGVGVWITRFLDFRIPGANIGPFALSAFWIGITVARLTIMRTKIRPEVAFAAGCLLSAASLALAIRATSAPLAFALILIAGFVSGAAIPQLYHLISVWNPENALLPTSVVGVTLYIATMLTAPFTAIFFSGSMVRGMITVVIYAVIGGAAFLPLLLKKPSPDA